MNSRFDYTIPTYESKDGKQNVLHPTSRRQVALWYAEQFGWLTLPAEGKQPIVAWRMDVMPEWPGIAALAELWRGQDWGANIVVLTGKRSGVVVGDVDPRHGGRLEMLWEMGWPTDTPRVLTGSGGWHVYAACPPDGLPSIPTYAPGIEVKADGALVVVPPSRHPDTHNLYTWLEGYEPWNMPVAQLPESLILLAQMRAEVAEQIPGREPLTENEVRERWPRAMARIDEAVDRAHQRLDNGRHNTLIWLANRLVLLGLTPELPGDPLRRCLVEYRRRVEKGWAE